MINTKSEILRIINSISISTKTLVLNSANRLEIEVGSNGLQGGDASHGSRTYLRITDLGNTAYETHVLPDGIEIILGGDSELRTLAEALTFASEVLKSFIGEEGISMDGIDYGE